MAMENIKVVVVGDGAVGKTCILVTYTTNTFPEQYDPTVFENYSSIVMVDNKTVALNLWDTAGQEDFSHLRPLSYINTDVFIVCYSVISPSSFENVKSKWIPELQQHCANTPIILVGTKIDIRDDPMVLKALSEQGKAPVTTAEGQQMQHTIRADRFIECSALTQKNIKLIFEEAARVVIARRNITKKKSEKRLCTIL